MQCCETSAAISIHNNPTEASGAVFGLVDLYQILFYAFYVSENGTECKVNIRLIERFVEELNYKVFSQPSLNFVWA